MRRNFPRANDVSFVTALLNAKTTPSRTKAHRRVFTAVFIGRFCVNTIWSDSAPQLTSHAALSDSARSDRRTNTSRRSFSGKTETSHEHAARSHSSRQAGRERPQSERVRGRLPGVAEGVAHAPSSLSTIIRAASAAAQSAAAFPMTTRAHPLARQRVAASASSERRHHHHRQSAVQFSGLKGDNSDPRRCPPFCPPCPSASAAIN